MKHGIRQMLNQGRGGSIVNLASIAGINGMLHTGPYAATKHAVVGLSKSAALDYATANIRVNAVAPGAIKTEMMANLDELGIFNEDEIIQMFPMMRIGRTQEIADTIVWLCSDESSFATGTILNVDGGYTAK